MSSGLTLGMEGLKGGTTLYTLGDLILIVNWIRVLKPHFVESYSF